MGMRAGATARGPGRPPRRRRLLRHLLPTLRPGVGHRLPPELAPRRIGVLAAALPTGGRGPELETRGGADEQNPPPPDTGSNPPPGGDPFPPAWRGGGAAPRHEVLLESY